MHNHLSFEYRYDGKYITYLRVIICKRNQINQRSYPIATYNKISPIISLKFEKKSKWMWMDKHVSKCKIWPAIPHSYQITIKTPSSGDLPWQDFSYIASTTTQILHQLHIKYQSPHHRCKFEDNSINPSPQQPPIASIPKYTSMGRLVKSRGR